LIKVIISFDVAMDIPHPVLIISTCFSANVNDLSISNDTAIIIVTIFLFRIHDIVCFRYLFFMNEVCF